jgi:hypothetical protein
MGGMLVRGMEQVQSVMTARLTRSRVMGSTQSRIRQTQQAATGKRCSGQRSAIGVTGFVLLVQLRMA